MVVVRRFLFLPVFSILVINFFLMVQMLKYPRIFVKRAYER